MATGPFRHQNKDRMPALLPVFQALIWCYERPKTMNRYTRTQDFVVADASGFATDKRRDEDLSVQGDYRVLLGDTIRSSVFPRARNQIASKGIMQIEEPDFPAVMVERYVELLLRSGPQYNRELAIDFLYKSADTLLSRTLFLEKVARQLGQEWSQDDCDFVDVTIVSARLQSLVHVLESEVPFIVESRQTPAVQIFSIEAEQHTLMSSILGLLFASIGWRASFVFADTSGGGFADTVSTDCDAVCFSWSSDACRDQIIEFSKELQTVDYTKRPIVIAGGLAAQSHVDDLLAMGIDCICDSIYAAVNISERYIASRNSSHRMDEARHMLSYSMHLDSRVHE